VLMMQGRCHLYEGYSVADITLPARVLIALGIETLIVSNAVTAMAAGSRFTLFLQTDGSLWGMGANGSGQLGDSSSHRNSAVQIAASNVVAIAAGQSHSLFLKTDGRLWGTGYNNEGELGDGTTTNAWAPEQILSSNVVAISAGSFHSLFLKSDGSLWAMGYNGSGQLGDGSFNNSNHPEPIVASGVTAISAGNSHSLFLKVDGTLWGMGDNSGGELGAGSGSPSPRQLIGNAGDLVLQGTCLAGGTYHLLASTNLSKPLNQWTPILTNFVSLRRPNNFSAIITNVGNSGSQFYILQGQ